MSTTTATKLHHLSLRRPTAAAAIPSSARLLLNDHRHRRRHLHLTSATAPLLHDLPARRLPPIYSDLTPGPSHTLGISLSSFLPPAWTAASAPTALPRNALGAPALPRVNGGSGNNERQLELPPAHHLVYFNPVIPADKLLPDGTDPLQSPGEPFVRRMWAGGYVRFAAGGGKGEEEKKVAGPVVLDGRRWVCVEGIRDVAVKGVGGEEKVFVGIERRIGRALEGEGGGEGGEEEEERVRRRLWTEREEEWGEAALVERRNIVFMRGRTREEARVEVERARGKMLFSQNSPDFTHTLVPTPSLLFRYSALTFNAHAIHLDPHYCRTVEGHRNLLFHGPLSFTLLATLLQNNIPAGRRIAQIQYRNLAPLYCDEPVKLCGRKADSSSSNGQDKYELWAETPEGGLAVKGTAHVIAA
ncbi:prephenate dehydratase protein [Diplodia corticola]|uniref:Prephenate dehydratase protein n=1 Tax=Diplodia corticola TaxID=236234 RepID=A0A1J9RRC7_9PEZI|nr:prephenate dehydratase protein [Diplodia corticola]OJD30077.1 prephenate dehydratase protein [Diplodia corticola]